MMAANYYAVRIGRNPGIYKSWIECKNEVNAFSGAVFKKFKTESEALNFLSLNPKSKSEKAFKTTSSSFLQRSSEQESYYHSASKSGHSGFEELQKSDLSRPFERDSILLYVDGGCDGQLVKNTCKPSYLVS
jgi:viroplasmin and RNaseH domain-containing protein